MVDKIVDNGKKFLFSSQNSVLSASLIIMFMVVASRILGLIRLRALALFFTPEQLSFFFAAFRLPDSIFETLVFGSFSSAFIPVFTGAFVKNKRFAWQLASSAMTIGIAVFLALSFAVFFFADELYGVIAPGFGANEKIEIVRIAKVLFIAQGFFIASYVLTGVLESARRFLIPALAPVFYNLGIIVFTFFFSGSLGLLAPSLGVVFGAFLHLAIQVPLARKLGFRFRLSVKITPEVIKIGRLAYPRVVEIAFAQVGKNVELYLSSFISAASYGYLSLANSLALFPVGLFGVSIAKAALPTLARKKDSLDEFNAVVFSTLKQMIFLALPVVAIFIVVRVPIVRLVFGTEIFTWEATIQTSLAFSAILLSVVFQVAVSLLSRAFYAREDTKTPVIISLVAIGINIFANFLLVSIFKLPTWGIALSYSLSVIIQAFFLLFILIKKTSYKNLFYDCLSVAKLLFSALVSGGLMYFTLKIFDRSVWIKRLSFLSFLDPGGIPFEAFVLDTRYAANLLALTLLVGFLGSLVYLVMAYVLRADELFVLYGVIKRILGKKRDFGLGREKETIIPPAGGP